MISIVRLDPIGPIRPIDNCDPSLSFPSHRSHFGARLFGFFCFVLAVAVQKISKAFLAVCVLLSPAKLFDESKHLLAS